MVCIAWSVVCYLGVGFGGLVASVGEGLDFLLSISRAFVVSFRGRSSSSGCSRKTVLLSWSTPSAAFHTTILLVGGQRC